MLVVFLVLTLRCLGFRFAPAIAGAIGKFYDLSFKVLRYLLSEGIHARAAAMTDPKFIRKRV